MNTGQLNTVQGQFQIVLLFWGGADWLDTDTGEIRTSQKAYRMKNYAGKGLKDLFSYFTAALKGETWKNRIPRKLVIYEHGKEIFRLPQEGAITDRFGNKQKRLASVQEWRECTELYERSNGRMFRRESNHEPKNEQKKEIPVAFQSNTNVEQSEKDRETILKYRVWEKIKAQFQAENLIVDSLDEKHVWKELQLRNVQHVESYFDEAMEYLRKAHERFAVAREEAEQKIQERKGNIEATTISKDAFREFKSPVGMGFKPTPKVTTNSNPSLDEKKAEAVQELYDHYKEKHQKPPSNGRISVWQNVMSKSYSETEIDNQLAEIKQNI